MKTTDMLQSVLERTRGRYLSEEEYELVQLIMSFKPIRQPNKVLTDKELIIFLMDEIDTASDWLVQGQTHMATGVLGQCYAEIRKHLSK